MTVISLVDFKEEKYYYHIGDEILFDIWDGYNRRGIIQSIILHDYWGNYEVCKASIDPNKAITLFMGDGLTISNTCVIKKLKKGIINDKNRKIKKKF